jgi:hypothetical protein
VKQANTKWRGVRFCVGACLRALLCVPLLGGCAGYQIGNASLYPANIHTVSVPMFESVSFRRNLGERLTEAVVKEIELRTPFKVVNSPNADSVLTGQIVGETKNLQVMSPTGDPRDDQMNLQVKLKWTDRRGCALRDPQSVAVPAELVDLSAASDVVPEMGQSVATAQQRAIVKLARQIVGLMEAPW